MQNLNNFQFNFFKNYLAWISFYLITNQMLSTIATFYSLREVVTQVYLFLYLFIDLVFIVYAIFKFNLRFKALEIVIILFVFIAFVKTLTSISVPISRRTISDILNPVIFIFKISVFRSIFFYDTTILGSFVKKNSILFLASTFVTVCLFFLISRISTIYIGLTPPIELPYATSFLNGGFRSMLSSFLLIILSGKRSFLLAAILCFLYYYFFLKRKNRLIKIFILTSAIISLLSIVPLIKNLTNPAIQKYVYTIETISESDFDFNDEESVKLIDIVSGGRFSEIFGSTNKLSIGDILLGKGPGFTYQNDGLNVEQENNEYSNVHFTPVNFLTKYGLFFTVLIYYYLLSNLFISKELGNYSTLFKLMLFMYLVEMLFAFNIFVEPLIPLCLGYLTHMPKKNI